MATNRSKAVRPAAKANDAYAEAEEMIAALGPTSELAREVRRYPVELLRKLCAEHRARGGAVPDHALDLIPYLGETALRALLVGGLAQRVDDTRHALHSYQPTAEGIKLADRIESDLASRRKE